MKKQILTTSFIRFINIILAALLAGVSFGIWIGFNPGNLTAECYLEQQQNTIRSLSVLMTSLVIVATLITLTLAFLQRSDKGIFISLLVASLFLIACIIISAVGNRPLDKSIITWTSTNLPANWVTIRDKWWLLHIMRTLSELIALVLITWASVRKDNTTNREQFQKSINH